MFALAQIASPSRARLVPGTTADMAWEIAIRDLEDGAADQRLAKRLRQLLISQT
jgi:hypothetical protein